MLLTFMTFDEFIEFLFENLELLLLVHYCLLYMQDLDL